MEKLTRDEIASLREFLAQLEAHDSEFADKEIPGALTPDDWKEFEEGLAKSGEIPEKFVGRVELRQVTKRDTGEEVEGFVDIALDAAFKRSYKSVSEIWAKHREPLKKILRSEFLSDTTNRVESIDDVIKRHIEASEVKVLDITNLPNLLPTNERFQYAITPQRNKYAYIMPFDYEKLEFAFDEDGEIIINSQESFKAIEEAMDKDHAIIAAGIDQPLLRQLFAATMKAYLCQYGNSITVSLPAFAREMNIDIRGANEQAYGETKRKPNNFFKKLKALENLSGVWQEGSLCRVFVLEEYNRERNELTFSSPWLIKITKALLDSSAPKKIMPDGSVYRYLTGVSDLMKASINSARSKPTVEIVASLLQGLTVRGVQPDSKLHPKRRYADNEIVTYSISFKTLIDRIPLIRENLDAAKPSNKTVLLQRYFCGNSAKGKRRSKTILQEYIEEYTRIKEYYKDFTIRFNTPTWKTIDERIVITHHGINGDYKRNNSLLIPVQGEGKEEV